MPPKNQSVLITGATRGIGKATALHLARRGHRVMATGRNEELLAQLETQAKAESLSIAVGTLDVTDAAAIQRTVARAIEESGRLDALINNAASSLWGALEELTLEEVRGSFDTNLFSIMELNRAVLPHMRGQGFGTIVNVGSVAGAIAAPMEGCYSMTKFALHSMSRSLRMEVGRLGVRVVLVEPGVIRTDFQANKIIGREVGKDGSPYARMSRETELRTKARAVMAKGPARVATRIREVIESGNPRPRYAVGLDARAGTFASRVFPDWLLDFFVRRSIMG